MINTKAIVKVQFKTSLSEESLQAVSSEDIPILAKVPGLISKLYHINPETGYLGAVYHFENEASADNYIQSPMIKTLEDRYSIVPDSLHVERVKVIFALMGKNTERNAHKIKIMKKNRQHAE
jgi:hypothetical protein